MDELVRKIRELCDGWWSPPGGPMAPECRALVADALRLVAREIRYGQKYVKCSCPRRLEDWADRLEADDE